LVGVQWVLVGYSVAFHAGGPWLGGFGWLGFRGVGLEPDPTGPGAALGGSVIVQSIVREPASPSRTPALAG